MPMTRTLALCVVLVCGCAPTPPEPPDVTATPGYFVSPEAAAAAAKAEEVAKTAQAEKRAADNARDWLCFGPLEAMCRNGPCADYDESAAEVRRLGATGRCVRAEVGTCGGLRFTAISDGFVGRTEYFDAAGELVAARTFTDVVMNPECPGWAHRGERVACSEVPTANYCAR